MIGRWAAVGNAFGVHLSGLPAWLLWAFIHLMYIVDFQGRIVVLIQRGYSGSDFQSRSATDYWHRNDQF